MIWGLVIDSVLLVVLVYYVAWLHIKLDATDAKLAKAEDLITEETKRKEAHRKAFENAVDPEQIDYELERAANLREMRDSGMPYMPRAGVTPATIYNVGGRRGTWRSNPQK